jgi:hypothetical protein
MQPPFANPLRGKNLKGDYYIYFTDNFPIKYKLYRLISLVVFNWLQRWYTKDY